MAQFGLQHRTSGRWLTEGAGESPKSSRALTFESEQSAENVRAEYLLDFADAWIVQPLPSSPN